jgi:hypothetical protein
MTDTASPAPQPDPRELPDVSSLHVGVLGGTGPQGRGLALRWAAAGHRVTIGSRDAARAASIAGEIGHGVTGAANADCAAAADVVVVAVPWDGHGDLLATLVEPLAGKVVVDCVNPLGFDKQGAFGLRVEEGSAAEQAAALLPAAAWWRPSITCRPCSCSTSPCRRWTPTSSSRRRPPRTCAGAGRRIPGVRGIYGGRLRNAGQVEAVTANLITMNRRYKSHAGVRITDV